MVSLGTSGAVKQVRRRAQAMHARTRSPRRGTTLAGALLPSAALPPAHAALSRASALRPQQALQQLAALASDLAMHSAGLHTQYVDRAAMPAAVLDAMRADFAAQTAEQMPGKPDGVVAKIVDGKVAKWCKEVCI